MAKKLIKELVGGFNAYELTCLDAMTGTDYTAHLLILLIDGNDTVNAKFLFQRVPEPIRESSQVFNTVWNAVKALAKSEFGDAIAILKQPFAPDASATSVFKDVIDRLRDILVWHLTEHTVPELIADASQALNWPGAGRCSVTLLRSAAGCWPGIRRTHKGLSRSTPARPSTKLSPWTRLGSPT